MILPRYLDNDRLSPNNLNILIKPLMISTPSKGLDIPTSSWQSDDRGATYQSVLSLLSVGTQHRGSFSCRPRGLPSAKAELHVVNGIYWTINICSLFSFPWNLNCVIFVSVYSATSMGPVSKNFHLTQSAFFFSYVIKAKNSFWQYSPVCTCQERSAFFNMFLSQEAKYFPFQIYRRLSHASALDCQQGIRPLFSFFYPPFKHCRPLGDHNKALQILLTVSLARLPPSWIG